MIAVTGASGFIGRELSKALHADGVSIRALVRPGRSATPGTEVVELPTSVQLGVRRKNMNGLGFTTRSVR